MAPMSSDHARARLARLMTLMAAASVRPDDPRAKAQYERVRHTPEFKKQSRRTLGLLNAYRANGIDGYIDNYLRNFLAEYNNRTVKTYGAEQPLSFNVMQAFIQPDETAMLFVLLPELMHAFALSQYLDHLTTPSVELDWEGLARLDELKVYEFNQLGSPSGVQLPGLSHLLFGGVALVRQGSMLSVCALFGEPADVSKSDPTGPSRVLPGKEFLLEDRENEDLTPEPFFGDATRSPLLVMMHIDIRTRKRHTTYLLQERADAFFTTHDDPDVYDDIRLVDPNNLDRHKEWNDATLAQYADVIELTVQLCGLPGYFDAATDDVRVERHPTRLRTDTIPLRVSTPINELERVHRPLYRDILTISTEPLNREVVARLRRSGLKRETSGYWKTLEPNTVGADKHDNVMHGKTWVTKDLTWMESPILEREGDLEVDVFDLGVGGAPDGSIYTLRSAAHARDVFKIGMTTRSPENRADELSSSTGQPDQFLVVEDWRVSQPLTVERLIHEALKSHRLSGRREFFQIKYKELRAVVERVVQPFLVAE